jgi:hypothetical protein
MVFTIAFSVALFFMLFVQRTPVYELIMFGWVPFIIGLLYVLAVSAAAGGLASLIFYLTM